MNALNKLIQERFADITQGASADVYPLTKEELKIIDDTSKTAASMGLAVGTDQIDDMICQLLKRRK
ncbi:MAG TPA: hypothetical protein VN038_01500 [Dyadobacter sp.]|nr:hypothetical protein [Dyadobacter sp.]